jgi:hypothetical protein
MSLTSHRSIDSFAPAHSAVRPAHCAGLGAGSELVVVVFEQDVERGKRTVTARESVKLRGSHAPFTELQVELVRVAQFAWHAVASAKEGHSRSRSARELADYSES